MGSADGAMFMYRFCLFGYTKAPCAQCGMLCFQHRICFCMFFIPIAQTSVVYSAKESFECEETLCSSSFFLLPLSNFFICSLCQPQKKCVESSRKGLIFFSPCLCPICYFFLGNMVKPRSSSHFYPSSEGTLIIVPCALWSGQ